MDELTAEAAWQFLSASDVAHLAVIDRAKPYVTPMSFVVADEKILFRTGHGRRLEAIRANAQVCVETSTFEPQSGEWTSVVAEGTAVVVDDPELEAMAVQLLLRKYEQAIGSPFRMSVVQPLPDWHVVVAVGVETIGGRSSGAGFSPRLTPGRL